LYLIDKRRLNPFGTRIAFREGKRCEMNILVFKPDEYFSKEMCHFRSGEEDSIHFAVTRKEMIRLAKDLRPEIAILGELAAMDTEFCTALRKENPFIKICRINNEKSLSKSVLNRSFKKR
jgi:hypothetical protein